MARLRRSAHASALGATISGPTRARSAFDAASLRHAARRGSSLQLSALGLLAAGLAASLILGPDATWRALHWAAWALFSVTAVWRVVVRIVSRQPAALASPPAADLPSYTIIAPLYREAAMVRRLADALCALDYPRDRLQVILALEADDPDMFEVMIAPPGSPQTKPRACNLALARARGEFVVVYDAEDLPAPDQLRQAAARFAAQDPLLGCVQAPLRIDTHPGWMQRQFALEYGALFDVVLPALARLGAPFPLGGTSNHFRTRALRRVGGWDAFNVTEDADVGFRLAAAGYTLDMIAPSTRELPPPTLGVWMPQRARWLKGYVQTWSVHMRAPVAGGLGRLVMLQGTVGLSIASALAHGPLVLLMGASALLSACSGRWPSLSVADAGLLMGAWAAAVALMAEGARRARGRMRVADALLAPVYWLLQSLAMAHALVQLATRPHHWDKTPHALPTDEAQVFPCLDELARERVSRAA